MPSKKKEEENLEVADMPLEETPALAIYEFLARVVIRGVVIVKHGRPTGLISRGCLLRFFMSLLASRKAWRSA